MDGPATMLLEDDPDTWEEVGKSEDAGNGDAASNDESCRRFSPRGCEDEEAIVAMVEVGVTWGRGTEAIAVAWI